MPTVKVIRIIQYEGTEEAVRKAIQLSKRLGVHQCNGYVMTIAEHRNELPQLIELLPEQVQNDIKRSSSFLDEFSVEPSGPFIEALQEKAKIEELAEDIYNSWNKMQNWVPWVTNGNSIMQDNARRQARIELRL